ncbi:MAG: 50S ribosomal protein L7/L12 [Candidatus Cloacimonadales bacterium]|jgi:large subunit ribosomal protein L7/L12|nr:50S ribosomal protein L7/L12 [Candidatus Cloacimonadales bacterium]
MSDKKQQIIDTLKEMTVIELSELVKELEEIFGVSAAAPVAVAAAGASPAAAVEEKTEFDVIITAAGEKKINVIKVVRELVSSLGLKEAKELVDNPPKAVLENVDKAEAEAAKAKLVEAGASVDIK